MGCNMIYPVIPRIRPPVTCSLRTKLQYTMRHQVKVLTDIAADLKNMEGVRTQEEELRKLELWRIENPPGVDHLGRVKRRRSIKGPSLMKCIRQVMNLSGAY